MAAKAKTKGSATDRGRVPGLVLLCGLLAAGLAWTAGARFARPVIRTASEESARPALASVTWPEVLIDVNEADVAELRLLPGIGPALAERIVADRETRGRFADLEDLKRVKRIGPAVLDRLRPYATVGRGRGEGAGVGSQGSEVRSQR